MSDKFSQMNTEEKITFITGIACLIIFVIVLIVEIALMGEIFAPQVFSMLIFGIIFLIVANSKFEKRMANEQQYTSPKLYTISVQCPVCHSSNSLVRMSDLETNHNPDSIGKEWRCKICGCYFNLDANGKAISS